MYDTDNDTATCICLYRVPADIDINPIPSFFSPPAFRYQIEQFVVVVFLLFDPGILTSIGPIMIGK